MANNVNMDHDLWVAPEHRSYITASRKLQEEQFESLKKMKVFPSADVLLPTDTWKYIDRDLKRALKTSALVYSTLQSRCTRFIPVGATVGAYRVSGGMDKPVRSALFNAATPENEDRLPQKEIAYQVPIVTQYWTIPFEDMEADRVNNGSQIYNESRFEAMDLVAREIESIILDGDELTDTKGLRDTIGTKRITHSTTLASASGEDWRDLFASVKAPLINDGHSMADGLVWFVNDKDWDRAGDREFSTQYGNMKISEYVRSMSGVSEIVATRTVKENEVIAVKADPRWLQFPTGLMPATEMYPQMMSREGMKFRTQAKIGNVIGEDYNGKTGVAYAFKS